MLKTEYSKLTGARKGPTEKSGASPARSRRCKGERTSQMSLKRPVLGRRSERWTQVRRTACMESISWPASDGEEMTAQPFCAGSCLQTVFSLRKGVFYFSLYNGLDNRHIMICHSQTFLIYVRGNEPDTLLPRTDFEGERCRKGSGSDHSHSSRAFLLGNIHPATGGFT